MATLFSIGLLVLQKKICCFYRSSFPSVLIQTFMSLMILSLLILCFLSDYCLTIIPLAVPTETFMVTSLSVLQLFYAHF